MKARNEIYRDIYERIRCSEKDWRKITAVKTKLKDLVDGAFGDDHSYGGIKFIGSTETGNSLKWIRDVDCVLPLTPYDSCNFTERLNSLEGELEGISFRRALKAARDICSCSLMGEKIGIIGVEGGKNPQEDLESDILYHPDFVRERLKPEQRMDVVLAKTFFRVLGIPKKHIGCGFTLEQLIDRFGSFDGLLEEFSKGAPIYLDNSGNFRGEAGPLTVTYPYSGLANLSARFTNEDLRMAAEYSAIVLEDPLKFLEDAVSGYNVFMWNQRAETLGDDEQYSSPDIFLTKRENRKMNRLLKKLKPNSVVDFGCANGFSTLEMNRGLDGRVIGIDSAKKAIEYANKIAASVGRPDVQFIHDDMTDTKIPDGSQEVVIMKRSLGNIPSRRLQKQTLEEAHRILVPSGRLYIYDSFQEPYEELSRLREKFGVPPLRQPNHTYLLGQQGLMEMANPLFRLDKVQDDTSTYHLITRVAYPVVMNFFGRDLERLEFASGLHRVASHLPSIGNYGASKLYTLRKNG